ncbi:MAG: hypothetical protein WC728_06300 [Elusimicrobiota bacterium]
MTAQFHEELVYEGRKTTLSCCPGLPKQHPRIVKTDSPIQCTACWRGYIGSWEVKAGRFFLKRLKGGYRLKGRAPLFAEWFSGELRIPDGEMLQYVHMGFETVFERVTVARIEKGVVVETRSVDNRGRPPTSSPPEPS